MVEPVPAKEEEAPLPPGVVVKVPQAGVDSIHRIAHESRRYRVEEESRPAPLRVRSLRAYWATWRVIWSYLWLRFRSRFHSPEWVEHKLRSTHLRNARRIERT